MGETRRENRPPTPGISPKIDIFQHILTTKPLTNFTHLKMRSKYYFQQCRISTFSGDNTGNTPDPAALQGDEKGPERKREEWREGRNAGGTGRMGIAQSPTHYKLSFGIKVAVSCSHAVRF